MEPLQPAPELEQDVLELHNWLKEHNLGRVANLMTDPEGDFGFKSISEMVDFTDEDVNDIVQSPQLLMKMAEKKRFRNAVNSLRRVEQRSSWVEAVTQKLASTDVAVAREVAQQEAQRSWSAQEIEEKMEEVKRQAAEAARLEAMQEMEGVKKGELERLEQKLEQERREVERERRKLEEAKLAQRVQAASALVPLARAEVPPPHPEGAEPPDRGTEEAGEAVNVGEPWAAGEALERFEVMKSMVFVKDAPSEKAESLSIVRQGHLIQVRSKRFVDKESRQWVELSPSQMQTLCSPYHQERGFSLMEDPRKGPLLRGPLPYEVGEDVAVERAADPDPGEVEEQLSQLRASRQEQKERERAVALRELREKEQSRLETYWCMEDNRWAAHRDSNAVVYKASHNYMYRKGGKVPKDGAIMRCTCQAGACFYTTGTEERGPQGGLWVEEIKSTGTRWVLVHGPGLGLEQPSLFRLGVASELIRVVVRYRFRDGLATISKTPIHKQATVSALKALVCTDTGLRPKATMLVRFEPTPEALSEAMREGYGLPTDVLMAKEVMREDRRLSSYTFSTADDVELLLQYTGVFEEDYRNGIFREDEVQLKA